MSAAELLLSRVGDSKPTGPDSWIALCPAHEDHKPSLSIRQVDDRVLLHCWSGCGAADVVASLGLSLADLFDRAPETEALSKRRRPPLPSARELLALMEFDVSVLECAFADVLCGVKFNAEAQATAFESLQSIRSVLDACHAN